MLLYFIVYYAMGLSIAAVMGIITAIKVIKKGHDLDHFNKFIDDFLHLFTQNFFN